MPSFYRCCCQLSFTYPLQTQPAEMDLDDAFRHVIQGDACIFLGAGFSVGAKNERGGIVRAAGELTSFLAAQSGAPEGATLEEAAEHVLERIAQLPEDRARHPAVRKCGDAMEYVIERCRQLGERQKAKAN